MSKEYGDGQFIAVQPVEVDGEQVEFVFFKAKYHLCAIPLNDVRRVLRDAQYYSKEYDCYALSFDNSCEFPLEVHGELLQRLNAELDAEDAQNES